MELLQGETLAEWSARRRASLSDLFAIYGQLCHALSAAHAAGIVHRDLKPENIFVAVPRQAGLPFFIKVLDFGIAKIASQHASGAATTSMGTPLWMAPEQTENGHVGPQTDVWALGLIAFALLTQRPYWLRGNQDDTTLPALMREILFEPLAPASLRARQFGIVLAFEQAFDAWFARAVAREPAARFANAGEAYVALTTWLSSPVAPEAAAVGVPPTAVMTVPPGFGSGVGRPPAPFPPTEAGFVGPTERGVAGTIGTAASGRDRPGSVGKLVGLASLVVLMLVGAGVFGWLKLHPVRAARAECANGAVRGAEGLCACPAGWTQSGERCVAPPPPPVACPTGQARSEPAGPCLCGDGKPPNANGACASCGPWPDQSAIRAVLKDAEARARLSCRAAGASQSSGTITITIAPTGRVVEASVGGALSGSSGASCVTSMFLSTSVPCFAGEPFKLKKAIALETH
jgi:eukaryotic-like serine/threonine-protein kinase